MGNCAGYCTGELDDKQNDHHMKNSFNKQDLQVSSKHNDFERQYGKPLNSPVTTT